MNAAETMVSPTIGDFFRFFAKVEIADSGCWEWTSVRMRRGYGQFGGKHKGKARMLYAHRLSFSWFKRQLNKGEQIDHLCFNTRCVNPDHLDAVTPAENVRRYAATITECKYGHPFDEQNTYRTPSTGRRDCKACNARRQRELRERRKAA